MGRPRKHPIKETESREEHAHAVVKEEKRVREKLKVVDTYYTISPTQKLLKVTVKSNGNKYHTYIGNVSRNPKLMKELKEKGFPVKPYGE